VADAGTIASKKVSASIVALINAEAAKHKKKMLGRERARAHIAKLDAQLEALSRGEVPAGLKLLTEDERSRLLDELEKSRRDLLNTLEKMPISLSTKARVDFKHDLEVKLKNIEDALAKFQTKKEIFIDISGKRDEEGEFDEEEEMSAMKRKREEEAQLLRLKYMHN
jgi:hypothetical protein